MTYPILAFKEIGDANLYGFKSAKNFRHTSRELLRSGIFKDVLIIDAVGTKYKVKHVRESGYASWLWGFSLTLKGRQIYVDFDLEEVSKESLENISAFVLGRLKLYEDDIMAQEWTIMVSNASSIEEVISCFY